MTRPLRVELAGGLYHVTSRGNCQEEIYRSAADRLMWLDLFGEVCTRFNWICHAWCQMTNHYHLVVETADANLSAGMRHLNGVYTKRFNRCHGRVGHVYQARYKAILVEKDAYLLALARYVVLNPVRARMVTEPGAWPWSSYRAMTGDAPVPPWLRTDWILAQLASAREPAVAAYAAFVQAGMSAAPIWNELRGQIYLGREQFVERLQRYTNDAMLCEVARVQRRPLAQPIEYYRHAHKDPHAAMAAAYASGDYSMRQIADAFGVHYATVSRAVRARADSSGLERSRRTHRSMLECKT
jgi:putative transposase